MGLGINGLMMSLLDVSVARAVTVSTRVKAASAGAIASTFG